MLSERHEADGDEPELHQGRHDCDDRTGDDPDDDVVRFVHLMFCVRAEGAYFFPMRLIDVPAADLQRLEEAAAELAPALRPGDAVALQGIRLGALLSEPLGRLSLQPFVVTLVVGARRTTGCKHFVIRRIDQIVPRQA